MAAHKANLSNERYWEVVGELSIGTTLPPNSPLIGRHCEVIVLANAPKYSADSHLSLSYQINKSVNTSGALVPQFVGLSYFSNISSRVGNKFGTNLQPHWH